jgi:excisionase family DNA binding protein
LGPLPFLLKTGGQVPMSLARGSSERLESMPVNRNVQSRPVPEALLTPAEVAALFRVDPKTVTRWAKAGKLSSIRTLGGHRRYRETEVRGLLRGVEAAE